VTLLDSKSLARSASHSSNSCLNDSSPPSLRLILPDVPVKASANLAASLLVLHSVYAKCLISATGEPVGSFRFWVSESVCSNVLPPKHRSNLLLLLLLIVP